MAQQQNAEFDNDYEEMLQKMHKNSIIATAATFCLSPDAKNCEIFDVINGGSNSNDGRSAFSSIDEKDTLPFMEHINHSTPIDFNATDLNKAAEDYLVTNEKAIAQDLMEIDGICIHLNKCESDNTDTDADDDYEFTGDNLNFDLNATFTLKTMNTKKRKAFLHSVLSEAVDEEQAMQNDYINSATKNSCITPMLRYCYASASPTTPDNKSEAPLKRSYRLKNQPFRRI